MKNKWKVMEFKDVCQISSGNSIKSSVKEDRYTGLDDGIPYIATKDISFSGEIDYANGVKIPFKKKANFRIAKSGSTLICAEGGSAGKKVALLNKDVCFVNKLFSLESNNGLNNKWVFYWCNSENFQAQFNSKLRGLIGGVSKGRFNSITIPVPPLPEQKRIVAILDEAFAAIDQAKANIERNIENAEELFQSKLNEVFSERGEGWEDKAIGDLGKVSMCKRIYKKETTSEGEIPFFKIGTFGKEPNAYISRKKYEEYKSKYSFPKKGNILISASGTIGRRVIYDGRPAYFQDSNIVWIDNNESLVLNDYLYYFYEICDWQPSKGATISRLYNDDLRKITISFPSLIKQKELIEKFKRMKVETEQLKSLYQKKSIEIRNLKKSLLQKAFSGELTAKESVI